MPGLDEALQPPPPQSLAQAYAPPTSLSQVPAAVVGAIPGAPDALHLVKRGLDAGANLRNGALDLVKRGYAALTNNAYGRAITTPARLTAQAVGPKAASDDEISAAMGGQGVPGTATPPQGPINYGGAGAQGDQGQQQAAPKPYMVGASNQSLIDPTLEANAHGAISDQKAAIQNQQDAHMGVAQATSQGLGQQADQLMGQAKELRGLAQQGLDDAGKGQAKLDAQNARIDRAASMVAQDHVDTPDQIWGKTSTFDQVRLGLADALGGFVMGFNHMDHNPIDAVHKHIQGVADAAEKNYQHDKGVVDQENATYARLRQMVPSPEEAKAAYVKLLTQATGAEAQAMAARTGQPITMAKAKEFNGGLQERSAEVSGKGTDFDIAHHKFVPAHMVDPNAANSAKVDWKAQQELSKELEKNGVPAAQASQQAALALIAANGGVVPGSGLAARFVQNILPHWAGGGEQSSLLSSNTRQFNSAVRGIGEANAHAAGQRGQEAIDMNTHMVVGNHSDEDVKAGLQRNAGVVNARAKNAYAAVPGLQGEYHRLGTDSAEGAVPEDRHDDEHDVKD